MSSSNSIMQNFQRSQAQAQALPVSQTPLRRRLPSLSSITSSPSRPLSSWSFPRSKSLSSMGDYAGSSVKIWWVWGWSWLLSKKVPIFAQDLEMNQEETILLGSNNKGSWRHVFYKLRSQINKLMGSHHVCLPQTYNKKKKIYG